YVNPFLEEVAEPLPPLDGVTLCGTPPCVHFQGTLSPLWILTVVGENALFLTETVLVDAAWAGMTAIAAPTRARAGTARSFRVMCAAPSRFEGLITPDDGNAQSIPLVRSAL